MVLVLALVWVLVVLLNCKSFDSTQLNKSIFKDLQFSKTTKNPPLCILDPWPQKLIRWEHFKYYSKCCTFLLLVFVITFLRIEYKMIENLSLRSSNSIAI